ncbi:MAG: DUF3408 domain-containing protein [Tannerellaceae bacterium]|nr:DUF3408 domain-containing protein [Tannerellaceae bacterium]
MSNKNNRPTVDEDFMKQIISNGVPITNDRTATSANQEEEEKKETPTTGLRTGKKKKNTSGSYQELFFKRVEIRERQPLYVNKTTHETLMKIVNVIGKLKVTISSYVENILLRHFEEYQDVINDLYTDQFKKPL